jgi:hypothetical protein
MELPSPPFQELIGHLSWHVKSRNEGVRVGHITEFPERGVGGVSFPRFHLFTCGHKAFDTSLPLPPYARVCLCWELPTRDHW